MAGEAYHLMVRIGLDRIECSCPRSEFNTCVYRLKNNYTCIEAIVRVSPVYRDESSSSGVPASIKSIDGRLNEAGNALWFINRHMDGIDGKDE